MKLSEIHFPVYRLSKEKPLLEDKVLYYKNTSYNIDTNETIERIRIIDDKDLPGDSLGRRRLQIPTEVKYRISRTYLYIKDVIKQASGGYWFIDNSGSIFQYKKSLKVPLICKDIVNVYPGHNGTGAVIEVKGLTSRFKTLYIPKENEKYAALLKMHGGYILYGLYEEKFEDSWRRV